MTDQDKDPRHEQDGASSSAEPHDEFAELEQNIRRRLRSNQRFLERFMDEDFDDDEDRPEEEEEDPPGEEL